MFSPHLDEQLRQILAEPLRRALRCPRPVQQPLESVARVAIQELVPSLAADPVLLTQRADGVDPILPVRDKLNPLSHGRRLLPRHGAPPSALHDLGNCHPCRWTFVLPISPDYTNYGVMTTFW